MNTIKDIIFIALIFGVFLINVASLYKSRKSDNNTYGIVFISKPLDWILSLLLITCVIISAGLIEPYVPSFLKFSVFSIIGKEGTNASIEIMEQSNKISYLFTIFVFLIMSLLIPKAAYWEEREFRYRIVSFKQSIFSNIKFGLIHCLIGVPLWIGLILIFVGFAFTWKYISSYKKTNDHDYALKSSTSLHGKYNMILLVLLLLLIFSKTNA